VVQRVHLHRAPAELGQAPLVALRRVAAEIRTLGFGIFVVQVERRRARGALQSREQVATRRALRIFE